MGITPTTSTTGATTPTTTTTPAPLGGTSSLGTTSVDGLASGIQSGQIIDALIKTAGLATQQLQDQQTLLQNRLDAVRSLNSKLLSAQLDLAQLRLPSTFLSPAGQSSVPGVATATATSGASLGSFQLTVDHPASAQQLVSAGFSSSSSSIGTGTVVIGAGSTTKTLTIDASDSSLDGLAAAINTAGIGMQAQVITDGTATPYRLVVTSTKTGAANTISLDTSGLSGGDPTLQGVTTTQYDPSSTSAVGLAGIFTGSDGPPQYLVQVDNGGTVGGGATFKWSKDGGNTWTSGVATAVGAVSLGDGVSVSFGAGDLTTGDAFTLRPMQQLAAAQDASIRYGSAGSTISVTSSSNSVSGLVPGVTLNLVSAGTTTITIGNDASGGQQAVQTFFDDLNTAIKYLNDNTGYDASTDQGGILIAQSDLRQGVDNIIASLTSAVAALPQGQRTLASIGVTLDEQTGLFDVDSSALSQALADDPGAVAGLFKNGGTTSDGRITFAALTNKTDVSASHSVAILAAATQATLAHGDIVAASTDSVSIDGSNDQLDLTINGESVSVQLANGSYSLAQLAALVQNAVNGAVATPRDNVQVSVDGLGISIASKFYGSSQSLTVGASSTATSALGITGTIATGSDVSGTIDGVAATGQGQVLSGAAGSRADGLQLVVTATGPVASATINAYKGLGGLAGDAFTAMTDVTTGTVTSEDNSISASITTLGDSIDKQNQSLDATRARLEAQFQAMETLINQFNEQGSVITQQVKGFENVAANK